MNENPGWDVPASQRDQSLPMIVNLRGDEEIVEQFTLDAEQAMEYLGIKRSRLTQISGRELRVGRIRRDRYLRPVYREMDLRDYQEWTRATATHQSSSKAIEQAIDSLDDRFQDLLVVLQEKWHQFQSHETSLVRSQVRELRKHVQQQFEAYGRQRDESSVWRDRVVRWQARQRQLEQQLERLQASQLHASGQFEQFHQSIREVITALTALRRELQDAEQRERSWRKELQDGLELNRISLAGLEERLGRLEQEEQKSRTRVESLLTDLLAQSFEEFRVWMEAQHRQLFDRRHHVAPQSAPSKPRMSPRSMRAVYARRIRPGKSMQEPQSPEA